MKLFPETVPQGGIIESEHTEIPDMKSLLEKKYDADLGNGRLFLKRAAALFQDRSLGEILRIKGFHYEDGSKRSQHSTTTADTMKS